ncbi:DUF3823 domain-containing protein [uncultured Chitinophaga sp.]|uniref:DUF3823 domain-containing protein n=1 Tax=uncultured Chitinophaga sp. TaxID=339340 RepID=UPI0026045941|nr:DUF3823 domain-containing protein [uncultured Chitinophaga sp.]
MKRTAFIVGLGLLLTGMAACEKDNYEAPDAALYGSIYDAGTKELLEQDVIRGSVVELKEHGWDNVQPQWLIFKTDGSYENSLLFEASYTVAPVRGNFIPVEPQDVRIAGRTQLDFNVTPYIRIISPAITRTGNLVTATFKLQQQVTNNVRKIGLYAHSDFRVGETLRLTAAEQDINAVTDPATTYSLTIDLNAPNVRDILKPGRTYFFRIGALIDAVESKPNYAKAVSFDL